MKIAIAHNKVDAEDAPDEADVLVQASVVAEALSRLKHESFFLPCDLDLACFQKTMEQKQPDRVFNLVESLGGKGRLIGVIPFVLDAMAVPFTGAPAESMHVTSHKVLAKDRMQAAGLPTPDWIGPWPHEFCSVDLLKAVPVQSEAGPGEHRWIIKSTWEHASLGISGDGLVCADHPEDFVSVLRERAPRLGGSCFAERFIDGREFNLSLLAGPSGPEVLPPAEIIFEGYAEDRPRIVCYSAKWDETSFEYSHTPRRFDFSEKDMPLIETLKKCALKCWHVFDLRGYARVDFRVDALGRPWILEVNANPCLSPDAGFNAALERAGISFADAVKRILDDALPKNHRQNGLWGKRAEKSILKHPVPLPEMGFRHELRPEDVEDIRAMTSATGFFHSYEIDVAMELVEDRLAKGSSSDYSFVLMEQDGRLAAYACYGVIPCTRSSYDLYWIVVHPDFQRKGIGRMVMAEAERLIIEAGGSRIYIDTSQSETYIPTNAFYRRSGYLVESVLKDFYAPGDGKVIFCKQL